MATIRTSNHSTQRLTNDGLSKILRQKALHSHEVVKDKNVGIIFSEQTKMTSKDDTLNAPSPLNHGPQQLSLDSRLALKMRKRLVSLLCLNILLQPLRFTLH